MLALCQVVDAELLVELLVSIKIRITVYILASHPKCVHYFSRNVGKGKSRHVDGSARDREDDGGKGNSRVARRAFGRQGEGILHGRVAGERQVKNVAVDL